SYSGSGVVSWVSPSGRRDIRPVGVRPAFRQERVLYVLRALRRFVRLSRVVDGVVIQLLSTPSPRFANASPQVGHVINGRISPGRKLVAAACDTNGAPWLSSLSTRRTRPRWTTSGASRPAGFPASFRRRGDATRAPSASGGGTTGLPASSPPTCAARSRLLAAPSRERR